MARIDSDLIVENHGSLYGLQPLTQGAREWLEAHTQIEPWQWFGGALMVDHRMAHDILSAMLDEGFAISRA